MNTEDIASRGSSIGNKYPHILLGLWAVGTFIIILISILRSDGHLTYSLDDPYIHLAVADNILHGSYGINPSEYSAPSSSIIYAFLLAVTERVGLGTWGPLVINLAAMGSAVYLAGKFIHEHVLAENLQNSWIELALGLVVCLAMNSWCLVMTGMEHSLHVLAVVLVLSGFLKILREKSAKNDVLLIAAIVALPLIRFEGAALSILSIMALFYLGKRKSAISAAALVALAMLSWYAFTKSLGLPLLPSSVQLKSDIATNALGNNGFLTLFASVLKNIYGSLGYRQGAFLMLAVIIVGFLGFKASKEDRKTAYAIGGLAALGGLAHVLFGRYESMSRYEAYVFTLVTLSGLALGREYLARRSAKAAVILSLSVICVPYAMNTYITVAASNNIYQQQYQMHRFAVEYWKRPVAVNDLGWVSYKNPEFVLDLWGLGSEEVRNLKIRNKMNRENIESLVDRKNVKLIMIYDEWYVDAIPMSWKKVAVLTTPKVSAAFGSVSFYITSLADLKEAHSLLERFGKTLPRGAYLKIK